MSRFIPCHLRTVRTACYTGQINIIIDNHVVSGVNQLNQKLHTLVKPTTDMTMIGHDSQGTSSTSQSSTSHICRDGDDMEGDVDDKRSCN